MQHVGELHPPAKSLQIVENIYYYYYNVIGIPCHVLTNAYLCVNVKHTSIVMERATTTKDVEKTV